jgi:hypothetical protein
LGSTSCSPAHSLHETAPITLAFLRLSLTKDQLATPQKLLPTLLFLHPLSFFSSHPLSSSVKSPRFTHDKPLLSSKE